jgi:hypothetical protein
MTLFQGENMERTFRIFDTSKAPIYATYAEITASGTGAGGE